jgi:hypothetical protein
VFLPPHPGGHVLCSARQPSLAAVRSAFPSPLRPSSAVPIMLRLAFSQSPEDGVADPHHSPLGLTLASGPTRGGHSLLACDFIAGSASRRTVWPLPSPPL